MLRYTWSWQPGQWRYIGKCKKKKKKSVYTVQVRVGYFNYLFIYFFQTVLDSYQVWMAGNQRR